MVKQASWMWIGLLCCTLALAQDTTSALMNEALDKPVKLELNGTLPQVMATIADQTGVRLQATQTVWDLLPWGQQTNINAKIENQTLRQALEAITRKLGLTFVLKDEAVELEPMSALRRLGRRATPQELAVLDLLASTPLNGTNEHPTIRQLLSAVDAKLENAKSPFAVEDRVFEGQSQENTVFVARNATLMDALEAIDHSTAATWYPWGKSIVIVTKQDQVRNQLAKTVSVRYKGVDISQVLLELSQRAGVPFDIEPGAIGRIPPEFRNIRLLLDNASIKQALDSISGFTGLMYVATDKGLYFSTPAGATTQPARDPIVGLILVPDLNLQVTLPQSQVPPDVQEYLQYKKQKEIEKLRQMMKDENFHPTTQPAIDHSEDL